MGGKVTKRVFPPLNTTDYSSYAQQMPTDVDGTFVAVGGAGLIPFLKAYEQAHGPIDGKKFIGNLFWGTPGQFEQLSTRVAGAYVGGAGTAGDLATTDGAEVLQAHHRQVVQDDPAVRRRRTAGVEHVHVRLLHQHVGPDQGPAGGQGRHLGRPEEAPGRARARCRCRRGYGPIKLDKNRQGIIPVYYQQLYRRTASWPSRPSATSRTSTRRSAARSRAARPHRGGPSRPA